MILSLLTRTTLIDPSKLGQSLQLLDAIEAHLAVARRALEAGGPNARTVASRHVSLALELETLIT